MRNSNWYSWIWRVFLTSWWLCLLWPFSANAAPPEVAINSTMVNAKNPVYGTVSAPDLREWWLYYRPVGKADWTLITNGTQNVQNNVLAFWDTTTIANGYYELRLVATNVVEETSETTAIVMVIDPIIHEVIFEEFPVVYRSASNQKIDDSPVAVVADAWPDTAYRTRVYSKGQVISDTYHWFSTGLNVKKSLTVSIPARAREGIYDLEITILEHYTRQIIGQFFYPGGLVVDNTIPEAELWQPDEDAIVSGTIPITGRVFDQHLLNWDVNVTDDSGIVYRTSGTENISGVLATWDTTKTKDGWKRITLKAVDKADAFAVPGNQTEITRNVLVDNKPPSASITTPNITAGRMNIRGTANDVSLTRWTLSVAPHNTNHWQPIAEGDYPVVNNILATWNIADVPSGKYTLRLEVEDALGRITTTTRDVTILVAPELHISSEPTALPWNVHLEWSYPYPQSVTSYELWRRTYAPDGTVLAENMIYSGKDTSFETTDQLPGKFYTYVVQAALSNGFAVSREVTYWTVPIPTASSEIYAVRLDWMHPGMDIRYQLLYENGNHWNLLLETDDNTVLIPVLHPNKVHRFALAPATLPDGGYPWRAEVTAYALWDAPGAPTYPIIDSVEVTIQWTSPEGAGPNQLYRLYRDGVAIWEGAGTTYVDRGLTPLQTYRYAVAALNAALMPGALSPETRVTTGAAGYVDAEDILTIVESRIGHFADVHGERMIPYVRTHDITLRWNITDFPEWVNYSLSINDVSENELFTTLRVFSLGAQDGLYTIFVRTNSGDRYFKQVVLDTTPPVLDIAFAGQADGYTTIRIEASDYLAPSNALEMSINGADWIPYQPIVRIPLGEANHLMIQVRDVAGNVATQVLVDRTPPVLQAYWAGQANATQPGGTATLVLYAQDDLTKTEELLVSIDGGPWQPYQRTLTATFTGEGPRSVPVRVRDAAGNIATQILHIYVLP